MNLLDLTLGTPAENLALDEALLEEAEASAEPRETLRIWESPRPLVVVGRSSQLAVEVKQSACATAGIEVLRRASGGAAIVAGPGCLMYAVVLSYELRPALRSLDETHRFVLGTLLDGLRPLVPEVARQGTSDVAVGHLKFSGNSVRCKRRTLLYHGTLLYHFDLPLIERCLAMPPREPEYRHHRPHGYFVTNLAVSADHLRDALVKAWGIGEARIDWPHDRVRQLVADKYSQASWNAQH